MRKGPDRRTRPRREGREGRQRAGRARGPRQHRRVRGRRGRPAHLAGSIPMAASTWAAACARLRAKTCAPPWSAPAPSSARRIAKFFTCFRASSSSMTSPASSIRWAWSARAWKSICTSPPAPAARCRAPSPAPIAPALKSPRRCSSPSPRLRPRFPPTSANWASACSTSARTPPTWWSSLKARSRTPASVPVGGTHFTNDLAIGLHMPLAQAEELKRQYGHAVVTAVPQDAEIEIANPAAARRSRLRTRGGNPGAARARAFLFCAREPAPGRRARRAGRGLRAHRRRRDAARHARPRRRASCACRRAPECRCGFRICRASWLTPSFPPSSACCCMRIARASCATRKTTACAPSCAPSLQQSF